MLTPEAYGIVAMPMIFLAISNCFIDSGFANALVRKPELKEEDLSTAFYFNIGVGAFFSGGSKIIKWIVNNKWNNTNDSQ